MLGEICEPKEEAASVEAASHAVVVYDARELLCFEGGDDAKDVSSVPAVDEMAKDGPLSGDMEAESAPSTGLTGAPAPFPAEVAPAITVVVTLSRRNA